MWWCDHLSRTETAILGAVAMPVFTGLSKYVVLPVSKWLSLSLGAGLYAILSGAVVLDPSITTGLGGRCRARTCDLVLVRHAL